jgi:acyl dehydratase
MSGWTVPSVGAVVPPLTRTIELADMVAYAGATWDWHRLHYDPAYLAEKQVPKPVVDGQVFGALLAEAVLDWLGPEAFLAELSFRFRALVFAGETVQCDGSVTSVEDGRVGVDLRVVVVGVDGSELRVAAAPCAAVVVRRPEGA